MNRHLAELNRHIPKFPEGRMLDLGSGRGYILVAAAKEGYRMMGLELSEDHIKKSHERAQAAGVSLEVVQGNAEKTPFPDSEFDFINCAEVMEHVEDPDAVLSEIWRTLRPGGYAYVSVPSRFSVFDPHYHLYFVNWLPRAWSDAFIRMIGKGKDDVVGSGKQKLSEMYYDTWTGAMKRASQKGFIVSDIRLLRIKKDLSPLLRAPAILLYMLARPVLFDANHMLLHKAI